MSQPETAAGRGRGSAKRVAVDIPRQDSADVSPNP